MLEVTSTSSPTVDLAPAMPGSRSLGPPATTPLRLGGFWDDGKSPNRSATVPMSKSSRFIALKVRVISAKKDAFQAFRVAEDGAWSPFTFRT